MSRPQYCYHVTNITSYLSNLVPLPGVTSVETAQGTRGVPTKEELQQGFELGEWEVFPARGILRSGDSVEKPEPKVLKVLMALARRDGDLVSRDELIDEIWDGRPTSDEPINRCLSQLRNHLGDKDRPHQYIETLTRRGYRLKKRSTSRHPRPRCRHRNSWRSERAGMVNSGC